VVVIVVSFQTVKMVLPCVSGTVKHMVVVNDVKNLDATTVSKVPKILTVSPMAGGNVVESMAALMQRLVKQITVYHMVEENAVQNKDV